MINRQKVFAISSLLYCALIAANLIRPSISRRGVCKVATFTVTPQEKLVEENYEVEKCFFCIDFFPICCDITNQTRSVMKKVDTIETVITDGCCYGYVKSSKDDESLQCRPSSCPYVCIGGRCNTTLSSCTCFPEYQGVTCEKCVAGNWGPMCESKCNCRGSACDENDGGCDCQPGYHGDICERTCLPGTFGMDCNEACACVSTGGANFCNHINGQCTPYCDELACNECDGSCRFRTIQTTAHNGSTYTQCSAGGQTELDVCICRKSVCNHDMRHTEKLESPFFCKSNQDCLTLGYGCNRLTRTCFHDRHTMEDGDDDDDADAEELTSEASEAHFTFILTMVVIATLLLFYLSLVVLVICYCRITTKGSKEPFHQDCS